MKPGPKKPHSATWKKGQSGNPRGRATPKGYQDFLTRAKYLIEQYTAWQIMDIVKKPDAKTWNIPARDLMIMVAIADGFMREGGMKADKLLDRLLGKPTETHNINQQTNVTTKHFSVQEIDGWIKELAGPREEDSPPPTLPH